MAPLADKELFELIELVKEHPDLLQKVLGAKDPEEVRSIIVEGVKMPITSDDELLMEECRQFSRRRIVRNKHHTACVIRVVTGEGSKKFRHGLQRTYRRMGKLERCSEEAALSAVDVKGGVIVSAVAMHYLPNYPEHSPAPVCPCPLCAERWMRQQEEQEMNPFGVIIPFNDQIVKIPPQWLGLFRYASDYASHIDPYPNGDTNGS